MYCCCDNLSFEECQERNIVELSEEQINAVKLIFIPTTAGTGAETSGGGPLLNTKTNVKGGPFFGSKYSVLNILDPKLTVGLPPFLTYTTAMDALSHAIEGMSGKTRSPRTDMFCGQAVEYIWRSLPKVLENGADLEARGELLLAANLAIGVETLRHYAHAVAQPVGGMFHIAHGHTCALALPSAIHTIADNDQIQRELSLNAHKMGMNENSTTVGHDIADAITELNRDFGLKSLKEMGLNFEQIKQTIPLIMSDNRLLPNAVVPPTKARIEAILQNMYEY
jgi:alcohol dehydrogenase class IV